MRHVDVPAQELVRSPLLQAAFDALAKRELFETGVDLLVEVCMMNGEWLFYVRVFLCSCVFLFFFQVVNRRIPSSSYMSHGFLYPKLTQRRYGFDSYANETELHGGMTLFGVL